ncbi:MAG: signal peptide peptidase SppA [Treponema sp.]|nr:signal peptide peptidase SppA [Treponema sp.]
MRYNVFEIIRQGIRRKEMGKTIARIKIEGVIEKEGETYNQKWLLETIEKLKKTKQNVGIILYIESPGGSVYESDEAFLALKKYKEETKRPVYAYFASLAASGGYYIGCAADKIIANRNCITGSIGVIAGRFVDLSEPMKKYGIKAETIHAGKNKTMGSITEPVTDEQRAIMQSLADECYEQFTGIVAESRKLDIEKVREIADGRVYSASQAKELGLVDEIAGFEEAVEIFKEKELGDKEAAVEVKKFDLKQKRSLRKMLKGASSMTGAGGLSELARFLNKKKVAFPAFLYEGNLR